MTIRKAAFELCKAVGISPAKKQIADLIGSIRNTSLHYHGHELHAQVLGYLLMHQKRTKFAEEPIALKLEALDEDKVKLLAGFHRQVTDLNERCVKPLVDSKPNCTYKVLSPYNHFDLEPIPEIIEIDIFAKEQTDNLVNAFHSHPQIKIAIDTASVIPATFSPEHYIQHILEIEDAIKGAGALERPQEFVEIIERQHPSSPNRIYIRHLVALTSLRASLSILNELLYSKIFFDQLLNIDENNTIKFGSYHYATGGSSVIFQNGGLIFLVETDDIIVLRTNLLGEIATKFCRVEKLDPHIPIIMPGEPRYAELREIDENLNPYGIMFDSL
jgi:hypothetical protein